LDAQLSVLDGLSAPAGDRYADMESVRR